VTNVVKLYPEKDPDEMLTAAQGEYKAVCIIGWNHDNEMDIRVDLNLTIADAYLIMALAQQQFRDHMLSKEE
jgi:hypothetical protein